MSLTDAPRIVTARTGFDDSYTIDRFLATGGFDGLRKALTMTPAEVCEQVDAASLLGRGGAGFPAGRKWSMLRKSDVSYLVINGDESEPATFKDHLLVEGDPHQLVEGVVIAAFALQVSQAFIFLRGEFALGLERVQTAVNNAAIGLYGEPTVVNNVETVSNLPWIVLNGGAAFAALGEGRSTGTRLFALSGHVRNPGVYELEMVKHTFRDLIFAPTLGGGIPSGTGVKAVIPGGVSAPWFYEEHLDLPLGQDEVAEAGSMLGSGSIVVMDETTCMVKAAWRITRFFSRESCGQCTPCREGSGWLERILFRLENGQGRREDLDLLLDLCDNIAPGLAWPPQQTTICVLGPSIPSSIHSSISRFRDEFLQHVTEGRCPHA